MKCTSESTPDEFMLLDFPMTLHIHLFCWDSINRLLFFFNDNVIHCIVKHKEEWSFHLKIYETSLWRVL